MSIARHPSHALYAALLVAACYGCKEQPAEEHGEHAVKPAVSAPAAPTSVAEVAKPPPPKPREDCPEGSSGLGTFDEPCKGSGDSRMMEVTYTGKTTDEGPKFSVTNKTKKSILYGAIAVYFYDKAGKQLSAAGGEKPRPKQICSGNIFAGAVKPEEKIFVFFSCVKKSHVPEGAVAIEAEALTVGFADESGNENEFYWKNEDLVPDERPKGGIKAAKPKAK